MKLTTGIDIARCSRSRIHRRLHEVEQRFQNSCHQTIPADLYEAAALEGSTPWQTLRRITLPLLTPYLSIALLFRLAQALGVFDLIQVLTGGGPAGSTESLALYAYLNAMRFLDFGYSATLLLGSFALLLTLCGTAALLWRWSTRLQGELR